MPDTLPVAPWRPEVPLTSVVALTAVVAVARGSSALAVRVAVYSCLEAMLPQVASNMARRGERDYLMQVQRTV